MAAVKPDRPIRGEGRTPSGVWQRWLADLDAPALAPVGADRRLVVVSPHPDDEILACGGLLSRHARDGGPILVIGVTDGEASHRGDLHWEPRLLGEARRAERVLGLRELEGDGASIRLLDLPDGAVRDQVDRVRTTVAALLRRDDLVVTTWRADGHPDHEATGTAVARACRAVGCDWLEAPVWMWHWSRPDDERVPWHRLRRMPLSEAAVARKAKALSWHSTQLEPRAEGRAPILGKEIRARARWNDEYFWAGDDAAA